VLRPDDANGDTYQLFLSRDGRPGINAAGRRHRVSVPEIVSAGRLPDPELAAGSASEHAACKQCVCLNEYDRRDDRYRSENGQFPGRSGRPAEQRDVVAGASARAKPASPDATVARRVLPTSPPRIAPASVAVARCPTTKAVTTSWTGTRSAPSLAPAMSYIGPRSSASTIDGTSREATPARTAREVHGRRGRWGSRSTYAAAMATPPHHGSRDPVVHRPSSPADARRPERMNSAPPWTVPQRGSQLLSTSSTYARPAAPT